MRLSREQQFELLLMSTMCDLEVDLSKMMQENEIKWPLIFKTTSLFHAENSRLYVVNDPETDRKFSKQINDRFNQEKLEKFKAKILLPAIIRKLVGADKEITKNIVDFFKRNETPGKNFSFEEVFNDFANKVLYNINDTKKLRVMKTFVANCDFMSKKLKILDKNLFNSSLKVLDDVCQIDNPNAIPFH